MDLGSIFGNLFGGGSDSFNYPSSSGMDMGGSFGTTGMPSSSQIFGGNSSYDLGNLGTGGGGSSVGSAMNSWMPGGSLGTGAVNNPSQGMFKMPLNSQSLGGQAPFTSIGGSLTNPNGLTNSLSKFGMPTMGTTGSPSTMSPSGANMGGAGGMSMPNGTAQDFLNPQQLKYQNAQSGGQQTNWLSKMLGQTGGDKANPMTSLFSKFLPSAGAMGLSSMIPNASQPKLPAAFQQYMQQMQNGGTPGMQSANNWYQGILNGTNQGPANAAVQSIDLNYQEQLRNLNAQYKSLRPGTDPSSDSTYQRDLANLNTQYQQQRSNALAGVQTGAAQGAAGVGTEQMGGLEAGVGQQMTQANQAWQNQQSQTATLRNALMGLFGGMAGNQGQMGLMNMLFNGGKI